MSIESRAPPLPAPPYAPIPNGGPNLALMVESMRRHMTDEGYQLGQALEAGDYWLCGKGYVGTETGTDVRTLLDKYSPRTLVLQDKREWEGRTAGPGFDPGERFTNVPVLKTRNDVFKVTILKDAQAHPDYHHQAADEMGAHAWIVYYHPKRVAEIAPYVRLKHLVRTYHTVDTASVPAYSADGRKGCVLSGAVSSAYPLRSRIVREARLVPNLTVLHHPGYHRNGADTPAFLATLSKYKVAICTASRFGYALRKIVEATAAGCRVITDLPIDDRLPEIDGNLIRIPPALPTVEIGRLALRAEATYGPDVQKRFSEAARSFYDYRVEGKRLADKIEELRCSYTGGDH